MWWEMQQLAFKGSVCFLHILSPYCAPGTLLAKQEDQVLVLKSLAFWYFFFLLGFRGLQHNNAGLEYLMWNSWGSRCFGFQTFSAFRRGVIALTRSGEALIFKHVVASTVKCTDIHTMWHNRWQPHIKWVRFGHKVGYRRTLGFQLFLNFIIVAKMWCPVI